MFSQRPLPKARVVKDKARPMASPASAAPWTSSGSKPRSRPSKATRPARSAGRIFAEGAKIGSTRTPRRTGRRCPVDQPLGSSASGGGQRLVLCSRGRLRTGLDPSGQATRRRVSAQSRAGRGHTIRKPDPDRASPRSGGKSPFPQDDRRRDGQRRAAATAARPHPIRRLPTPPPTPPGAARPAPRPLPPPPRARARRPTAPRRRPWSAAGPEASGP